MTGEARSWRSAALALAALPVLLSCATSPTGYTVDFGRAGLAWEGTQPHQILVERTSVVPRDVGGYTALGFEIHPPGDEPYQVYSVHYLPEARVPAPLPDGFEAVANGGIKTSTDTVVGPRVFSFGFDETDPLGLYRIEVFVNGRLAGEASIQVVEPDSYPPAPR
jgi:hypothetical protein